MKQEKSPARMARNLSVVCLIFFACFTAARAQAVIPYFNCVEPIYSNGTLTYMRAYYDYDNTTANTIVIQAGSNNFLLPPSSQNHPTTTFLPGYHSKSFSAIYTPPSKITWFLNTFQVTSDNSWANYCTGGTITYQGKLSAGGAAANGSYDLRFTLFDDLTGGTARAVIDTPAVPVASGVFTVELDVRKVFGATPDARFLEVAVRQAGTSDALTVLAPRQKLSTAPFAFYAQNALNATNATNAGNATNAANVSGGIVQLPLTNGAPPSSECNAANQYGRQKVDATNLKLWICTAAGWKSTVLQ